MHIFYEKDVEIIFQKNKWTFIYASLRKRDMINIKVILIELYDY
jgi:hypothetical protein